MLVFWLLSLGVGIANACVVHAYRARHEVAQRQVPMPGEAACIEFCAAEQTLLVKQQADPSVQQPPALVRESAYSMAQAAFGSASTQSVDDGAARPRQPVPILFLRLTL